MGEVKEMPDRFLYELIVAIVNRGHVDTVMDAAREAGAMGGTVVHAKGTNPGGTSQFFGMSIAEEKEMLLILSAGCDKGQLNAHHHGQGRRAKPRAYGHVFPAGGKRGRPEERHGRRGEEGGIGPQRRGDGGIGEGAKREPAPLRFLRQKTRVEIKKACPLDRYIAMRYI